MKKDYEKTKNETTTASCNSEFRENAERILNAEPIIHITGNEFKKSEINLISQVTTFFNDIGGFVHRDGLGNVNLTRDGVRSSVAHGIGRNKAAAFAAVPSVIQHGKTIDRQPNYKGRGYEAEVIAAPVKMGNEDFILEVVINKDKDGQRFYLHEVDSKEKVGGSVQDANGYARSPQPSKLITAKVLNTTNNITQ